MPQVKNQGQTVTVAPPGMLIVAEPAPEVAPYAEPATETLQDAPEIVLVGTPLF